MFELDTDSINESSIQSLHDIITHAKVILRQAKSNSWLLPNNIKRYFGPKNASSSQPTQSCLRKRMHRHISGSNRRKPQRSSTQNRRNSKNSHSPRLTLPHSHRLSSKKILRQIPKSKKRLRTQVRMYNVRKNSPRTQANLRIKISPKKFQETQLSHSNSNEEPTLPENHRKQEVLVQKIRISSQRINVCLI